MPYNEPDVRVVGLWEERHETRALLRGLEEDEAESHDGGATNVVVDVGDSHVEQTANGGVGARPAVRHRDGVHAGASQDGILMGKYLYGQTFVYNVWQIWDSQAGVKGSSTPL